MIPVCNLAASKGHEYYSVRNEPATLPKNNLQGCLSIIALVILATIVLAGISSIVSEGSPQ